ncbi:hypothetical protein MFRU_054g00010 [Monilinia fructicola]|nr:hypothetical protein MFRU_054g00010 [Monilinia fructicola]
MVLYLAEDSAVAYMRAARTFKIRSNKYRPDHGLKPENIRFDSHLRSRGKYIYLAVTDTGTTAKHQYELKLQVIEDEEQWNQSADPSLSPSSQGSITSPTEVESESLNAKRHNEIKTYLRYIKNGHNTIKDLEAFHQFRDGDKLIVAQYFKICDAGNVKQLRMDYKSHENKPPEMFIWKMYYQLIDALAFLHNEHPKYKNDPLHSNRKSILNPELGAENLYLGWPLKQSSDTCYPDLRLGDFGNSILVSPGEGVTQLETNTKPKEKPPELNLVSAKSDIWRAGSIIFSLAKLYHSTNTKKRWKGLFEDLSEKERQEIVMDPRRVRPIDSHYSEDLDSMIKRSLVLDHNERPSAGELLNELRHPATLRLNAKYMFKELPDWVGDKVVTEDNIFFEERLNELVQPGEFERMRTRWKNEEALKRRLLKKSLKEEKERKEMEAKAIAEENILSNIWAEWVGREEDLRSFAHLTYDEIDDLLERWTVVRSKALKRKLWVDPGPSYEEFCRLDVSLR